MVIYNWVVSEQVFSRETYFGDSAELVESGLLVGKTEEDCPDRLLNEVSLRLTRVLTVREVEPETFHRACEPQYKRHDALLTATDNADEFNSQRVMYSVIYIMSNHDFAIQIPFLSIYKNSLNRFNT